MGGLWDKQSMEIRWVRLSCCFMVHQVPALLGQCLIESHENTLVRIFVADRPGGKGISFDFGILTRDWGFPLEKIQTQISLWHGAEDDLAPVALARYIAEHIPDYAIKIVPAAGHAGTYIYVDEVMRTLV